MFVLFQLEMVDGWTKYYTSGCMRVIGEGYRNLLLRGRDNLRL
jgi:hypothetical protein